MSQSYKGYRALLVHAHPDDETINNGATMAMYAALGANVTLVTCTRGEEGEVLVPELAHFAAHETDQLGDHRVLELAEAMKVPRILEIFPIMPNVIPVGEHAYDYYHQGGVEYYFKKLNEL